MTELDWWSVGGRLRNRNQISIRVLYLSSRLRLDVPLSRNYIHLQGGEKKQPNLYLPSSAFICEFNFSNLKQQRKWTWNEIRWIKTPNEFRKTTFHKTLQTTTHSLLAGIPTIHSTKNTYELFHNSSMWFHNRATPRITNELWMSETGPR